MSSQRRFRPRRILVLIAAIALALFIFLSETVQARTIFFLNSATPRQVKWLWNVPDNSKVRWTTKCPNVIPGVLAAKWAGSWDTPRLRKPTVYSNGTIDVGPALLAMHIFSMPNAKGRARRKLIRDHNPLDAMPDEYRHLVDFKFVIGYPRPECRERVNEVLCPGVQAEEAAIREEQQYGDLLRVEGLKNGENMDEGKTWMWLRQVGRQEREAQWVMKCDDDNLPILQNIIPFLLTLNPATPTYLGQSWLEGGDVIPGHYFMLGYMYGMSWGVVKTLSTAQVSPEEIQLHLAEDVKTGQLMLSLPPIPFHLRRPARKYPPPKRNPYVDIPPPSTKTGLVRIDIRGYLSNYMGGDGYAGDRAFGWHNLKKENVWVEAWERARRDLGRKRLKWSPPRGLEFLRLDREEVVDVGYEGYEGQVREVDVDMTGREER